MSATSAVPEWTCDPLFEETLGIKKSNWGTYCIKGSFSFLLSQDSFCFVIFGLLQRKAIYTALPRSAVHSPSPRLICLHSGNRGNLCVGIAHDSDDHLCHKNKLSLFTADHRWIMSFGMRLVWTGFGQNQRHKSLLCFQGRNTTHECLYCIQILDWQFQMSRRKKKMQYVYCFTVNYNTDRIMPLSVFQ